MKMKPYPKYKDSGIEWIGEIPEGWEVKKIKHLSKIVTGSTPDSGNSTYWDGEINWITPADLSKREKYCTESNRKITKEGFYSCGTTYVRRGAIILATRAPIGYATLVKERLCFNQGCKAFEIEKQKTIPDYIYYFLNAHEDVLISQGNITTFGELSTYNMASFYVTLPPKTEQEKIASFLDKKTSEISDTIEKDKKLIELLKEKRSALINNAVTKGLDPNAKMKDSGIEWIGMIPEEEKIAKLKHITRLIIDGTHFTPDYVEKGFPFLRVKDIQSKNINLENVKYISTEEHKKINSRCNPKKGDLLLSKNGTVGIPKVIDWSYPFSIFVSLCLLKVNHKIDVDYLKYYLLTRIIHEQIFIRSKTTSVTNLHLDQIKEFIIVYPELAKQREIVVFLDRKTLKIDKTIEKIEKKISLLEEYKKSLIHHVITGKYDVRSVAA